MTLRRTTLAFGAIAAAASLVATGCPPQPGPTPTTTSTTTSPTTTSTTTTSTTTTSTTTTSTTTTSTTTTSTTTTIPALPVEHWQLRATKVTVNESRDCMIPRRPDGQCSSFDDTDEPYVQSIGFRVGLGAPGSAHTWVAGSRADATPLAEGASSPLAGAAGGPVDFTVTPLDVADLEAERGPLEVIGTYSWMSERGFASNDTPAADVAARFADALDRTVAAASVPAEPSQLLGAVLTGIRSSLDLLGRSAPTFDRNDAVLGGALFIGLGARGDLARIVQASAAAADFGFYRVLGGSLPILQRGGIFTTSGTSRFADLLFVGACAIPQCGKHTYDLEIVKI